MAGSVPSSGAPLPPSEFSMSELSVGCDGRFGRVGEGSRPKEEGLCEVEMDIMVGTSPFEPVCPFPFPFPLTLRKLFEMDMPRP
jgi:hypothetical protein